LASAAATLSALHLARGALSELKAATSHALSHALASPEAAASHSLSAVLRHHHHLLESRSHGYQLLAIQGSVIVGVKTPEKHLYSLRRHRIVHVVHVLRHRVHVSTPIPPPLTVLGAHLVTVIVLRLALTDAQATQ